MNHLSDEQFEDIMRGKEPPRGHLKQCPGCRSRLAEKRALAARLRKAFDSVKADSQLAARIRSRLDFAAVSTGQTGPVQIAKRLWPILAAAAAIMVIALPVVSYLAKPSAALAAQEELVRIHQDNLKPNNEFYSEADPEKLAQYFKEKLGFSPALPCTGQGMEMLGCCVAHFRHRVVGSYVVNTPKGVVSVIVVTDKPATIGMNSMAAETGDHWSFWKGSFAKCNMVTVRLGDYSYCAVGQISHKELKGLLSRLLPDTQN